MALLFGPALLLFLVPAGIAILLLGTMVVGILLLVAGFLAVPRRR